MHEAEAKQKTPPYLPHATFTGYLADLKKSVPNRIDRSVLADKSGTIQTYMLAALKYFDLINDEGYPAESLKELVGADEEEYKLKLKSIIEENYSTVFSNDFNLTNATQGELDERFGLLGLDGSTKRKAVSFFMAIAKEAGINMSPHFRQTRKRGPSTKPRKPRVKGKTKNQSNGESGVDTNGSLAKNNLILAGYFDALPDPGTAWSQDKREAWLEGLKGAFNIVYQDD